MAITSLILALCTTISGGSTVAEANRLELIKYKSEQLIEFAAEFYDYTNFLNLFDFERESLLKQSLLNFNSENELLDNQHIFALREHLYSDANYIEFENIDTMFIKDDVTPSIIENARFFKTSLTESVKYSPINNELIVNNVVINQQFTNVLISNMTDGGSSNGSNYTPSPEVQNYPLPIYNDESAASNFEVNSMLNGVTFIGIILPRETCIKFYNTVAGFLNTQVMNAANNTGSTFSSIIRTLLSFSLATPLTTVVESLIFYFKDIFTTFIQLFSGGALSVVVGIIIAIFAVLTLVILVSMFYLGFRQKGYAVGFLVHNIFNWEWYNDTIY